jgi:F-type H+-transporting ATPase subunit gamma
MPSTKEIRGKIKSVQNTRKITKAMEMVAASKMKKAQDRMLATRPYVDRALAIAKHAARANAEYRHPFLVRREQVRRIGAIVITTDKGLCGGLNTNLLRVVVTQAREWERQGIEVDYCAIGNKGFNLLMRMKANIVSYLTNYGDRPPQSSLIGPVKVLLDAFDEGRVDEVHVFTSRFINTMRQDPTQTTLVPIPRDAGFADHGGDDAGRTVGWDYLYEPDAKTVLDAMLTRYVEGIVFQSVSENIASEQSARMVAMKAASDNATTIIDELQLIYNKNRQAGITKEISEIVGGAAAV